MAITLNGTSGITDADGGTVFSSADIASLAQAQAGTDNTTVMTPLRTAQEITALGGGMILLGTLTTTSGTTQTLSGLDLTSYKALYISYLNLSIASNAGANFLVGGVIVGASGGFSATNISGFMVFDLTGSGIANGVGASPIATIVATHSLTTATTSITVSVSANTFDSGTTKIYGVR